MAAHAHTQIRNALAAALTGLATTGNRVYANRLHALAAANLPGLRLYVDNDEVQIETIHQPHVQSHRLMLEVEVCAQTNSALDDTVDQIAKEVEIALSAGITVGGQTLYPLLNGSTFDDVDAGLAVAVKRISFAIEYATLNTAPDALI